MNCLVLLSLLAIAGFAYAAYQPAQSNSNRQHAALSHLQFSKTESLALTPDARQASLRKSAERLHDRSTSSVVPLNSVEDYSQHILQNPDHLHIIRFSAPWCRVCKSTNVAWERMASKFAPYSKDNDSEKIQFHSVSIDGKNEEAVALKEMFQIERVPQGIIHHPMFGRRIDLNRKNLGVLKKRLERYTVKELTPGILDCL